MLVFCLSAIDFCFHSRFPERKKLGGLCRTPNTMLWSYVPTRPYSLQAANEVISVCQALLCEWRTKALNQAGMLHSSSGLRPSSKTQNTISTTQCLRWKVAEPKEKVAGMGVGLRIWPEGCARASSGKE